MALTPKQQAFIEEYLRNGRNASAAYRFAYPNKMTASQVGIQAFRMLEHPKIAPIIAEADAKAAKYLQRSVERYAISKERISDELARLAFVDARRLYRWDQNGVTILASDDLSDDDAAAVIEVSQTVTKEGGTIRVKVADKRQALVDLARLHGYVTEKRETRIIRSLEDLTNEELAAMVAEDEQRERDTRH